MNDSYHMYLPRGDNTAQEVDNTAGWKTLQLLLLAVETPEVGSACTLYICTLHTITIMAHIIHIQ